MIVDQLPPWLPLETIGAFTVIITALLFAASAALAALVLLLAVWVRFWQTVANLMWRGYSASGDETPPLYRMRIAAIAAALYTFQIRKIPAAWREAEEIADNDLTSLAAMKRFASNILEEDV